MRDDWVECELGDVLIQSKDKHTPEKIESLFYVGLEHIEKSTGDLTEKAGLSEVQTVKNKFSRGQILYGKLRPYLNKAHLAKNHGVCSTDILVFDVSPALVSKFALFKILSRQFVNDMSANTNGVNLPRVSTKYVNAYPFSLPPLHEQRAIVAKIEALFSDLDSGIADLSKAQKQLIIYRQAVLKKAFEGELTREWREQQTDLPSADELLEQIKEERQKHYEQQLENWKIAVTAWEDNGKEGKKPTVPKIFKEKEPLSKVEIHDLFELQKGATWKKIGEICSVKGGKRLPKGHLFSKEPTPYSYIMAGNLKHGTVTVKTNYINKETYSALYHYRVNRGDVYITIVGACIGDAGVVPESHHLSILTENAAKIICTKSISNKYLSFWLNSVVAQIRIKRSIFSMTLGKLALSRVEEIELPLYSPQEQNQIVQEIESRLSVCDAVEKTISESLEKAKALRQSILKKAFEGTLLTAEEIAHCKTAEDYQPASELLAKIKAEKLAQIEQEKAEKADKAKQFKTEKAQAKKLASPTKDKKKK